jgi:hypothetical protein
MTLTILQAQTIRSKLDSVHYSLGKRARYNSGPQTAQFEQKNRELFEQKTTSPSLLDSRNYRRAASCDYSTATKHRAKKLNSSLHAASVFGSLDCLDKSFFV